MVERILIRSSHFTTDQEPYIVHFCDFLQKVPFYLTDILVPFSLFLQFDFDSSIGYFKSYMYNFNNQKQYFCNIIIYFSTYFFHYNSIFLFICNIVI